MTEFRPDTSFPFFAYAHTHGLDYGEVLRAADFWYGEISPHLTYQQNVDIAHIQRSENERRKKDAKM